MPKSVCCGEKVVLVTVYVERPRTAKRRTRRRVVSNHDQQQYDDQLHHPITLTPVHGSRGRNRRAELLRYSHCLRESARSASSTPLYPKTPSASHRQQPLTKVVAVQGKYRQSRVPSCLGSWKVLIPRFLRSFGGSSQGKKKINKKNKKHSSGSASTDMKAIIKSLQVQKKWGFISKLLPALQKPK